MNGRITTSIEIERKIIELQKILKLSTKAAVMRIGIGISLNINTDPREEVKELTQEHNGATYQLITIVGDKAEVYRALIIESSNIGNISDEEFLELLISHISRGVEMLYTEYQLKGNYNKMMDYIFNYMED